MTDRSSDTQHGHVEGPWTAVRAVTSIFSEFFEGFLMLDPKTLFLINDQQSQIGKNHIFWQEAMGPTQYPTGLSSIFPRWLSALPGPETAENPNINWKICKSLNEVFIVLLGQDCCWNENGDLFSIVGQPLKAARMATSVFPKPTSPTKSRPTGASLLHIPFHFINGAKLVICFYIGEMLVEF